MLGADLRPSGISRGTGSYALIRDAGRAGAMTRFGNRLLPGSASTARVTYWCTSDGRIVLLTVFRKTRQHEQRQIDRAVRAQKTCERDHRGPATETYERQV